MNTSVRQEVINSAVKAVNELVNGNCKLKSNHFWNYNTLEFNHSGANFNIKFEMNSVNIESTIFKFNEAKDGLMAAHKITAHISSLLPYGRYTSAPYGRIHLMVEKDEVKGFFNGKINYEENKPLKLKSFLMKFIDSIISIRNCVYEKYGVPPKPKKVEGCSKLYAIAIFDDGAIGKFKFGECECADCKTK
jgi:hypothetical protein